MVWPFSTAASIARRDLRTASSAFESRATDTFRRATATTSAMEREWPSSVTALWAGGDFDMETETKAPERWLTTAPPRTEGRMSTNWSTGSGLHRPNERHRSPALTRTL